MRFKDRTDAGYQLASALEEYNGHEVVVYGLPRGGVVPAAIVARELRAPLDLHFPRKVGHPFNPEYAIAAVVESGYYVSKEDEGMVVNTPWFARKIVEEQLEAKRRRTAYLGNRKRVPADNKIAIVVDDGMATGLTMQAAAESLKQYNTKKIIVAVPVAPADTVEKLKQIVDEVVVLCIPPEPFGAVGAYYDVFPQVSDEEVVKILETNTVSIQQNV
jgi:predicted phosphoribosyltransferase